MDRLAEIKLRAEKATEIPGWRQYSINKNGEVFSNQKWRGGTIRQLTSFPNDDGYPSVRLTSLTGMRKHFAIHKLMAITFMQPKPEGLEIRHLDGNKMHPNLSNLRWGTQKENADDRELHGHTAKGSNNGASKLTEQNVREIKAMLNKKIPQRRIAIIFGVSQRNISLINQGKQWQHVE